ncbi:MAG: DNA-binding protein [Bacteroidia bacterium]|nr:DNA-binding protein [Bacteroidia bacterium]
MEKRLFTTEEAAAYLGISVSYMKKIRCEGQIRKRLAPPPFIRIGSGRKGIRYVKEDLDTWIDELPRFRTA